MKKLLNINIFSGPTGYDYKPAAKSPAPLSE